MNEHTQGCRLMLLQVGDVFSAAALKALLEALFFALPHFAHFHAVSY
jgi:hypothetical protein